MKKIYCVSLAFDIYVEAKGAVEAADIAYAEKKEEISNVQKKDLIINVMRVDDWRMVKSGWRNSIPYGHEGNETVSEILGEIQ